jgi:hypothetical protein
MSGTPKPVAEFRIPQPGPEHEVFLKDVGVWDADIQINPGPGAPPIPSKGVSRNRLGCGGLWLISEFLNETTGFEGHGIFGYDPAKRKYVGTWIDPMRTFLAFYEGSWDAERKTMTMRVETDGPQGSPLRWREVTETKDPDTQLWRQIMTVAGGQEFETMTVTYRRRRYPSKE